MFDALLHPGFCSKKLVCIYNNAVGVITFLFHTGVPIFSKNTKNNYESSRTKTQKTQNQTSLRL